MSHNAEVRHCRLTCQGVARGCHEHIEHLAQAAREMPRLSEDERDALRARVLGFLRGTLLPHARMGETAVHAHAH